MREEQANCARHCLQVEVLSRIQTAPEECRESKKRLRNIQYSIQFLAREPSENYKSSAFDFCAISDYLNEYSTKNGASKKRAPKQSRELVLFARKSRDDRKTQKASSKNGLRFRRRQESQETQESQTEDAKKQTFFNFLRALVVNLQLTYAVRSAGSCIILRPLKARRLHCLRSVGSATNRQSFGERSSQQHKLKTLLQTQKRHKNTQTKSKRRFCSCENLLNSPSLTSRATKQELSKRNSKKFKTRTKRKYLPFAVALLSRRKKCAFEACLKIEQSCKVRSFAESEISFRAASSQNHKRAAFQSICAISAPQTRSV